MKVLLGHCFYRSSAPSGEDAVYLLEKKLLLANGVEVTPFEKFNDNVKISTFWDKLQTARYTSWSKSSYLELKSLIQRTKPDVAHFHNTFPQMSPSVYQACHEMGVPVVQTLHNYRNVCPGAMLLRDEQPCELCLSSKILPVPSLTHKCYRGSLFATLPLALMIARNRLNNNYTHNVSRYIALTDFARDNFIRGGLPEDKIVVKPNFISDFEINQPQKEDYAVFVGRLSHEKGIKTLLKSWKNTSSLRLKVLGDGYLRTELEAFVKDNNLNVEFLGYRSRDDVMKVVSKASMQIIPSECYEGFPVSVIEAFACNTPVIASNLGSLAEIVAHEENGLLFEPKNALDLSSEVMRLANDTMLSGKISNNGHRAFMEKYSEKRNFKLLMSIYSSASIHQS